MNADRSASRFLIVSGTYLFLILLACRIQPVLGQKPVTEPVVLRDLFFLPLWLGIPLVAITARKIGETNGNKELMSSVALFWCLIFSVMGGFFLNLGEYNETVLVLKCMSNGVSVALLGLGYKFSHKKIGQFLLILELLFWTMKAVIFYNTSLDLVVSGYFSVACWVLRAVFLMKQLQINNSISLSLKV